MTPHTDTPPLRQHAAPDSATAVKASAVVSTERIKTCTAAHQWKSNPWTSETQNLSQTLKIFSYILMSQAKWRSADTRFPGLVLSKIQLVSCFLSTSCLVLLVQSTRGTPCSAFWSDCFDEELWVFAPQKYFIDLASPRKGFFLSLSSKFWKSSWNNKIKDDWNAFLLSSDNDSIAVLFPACKGSRLRSTKQACNLSSPVDSEGFANLLAPRDAPSAVDFQLKSLAEGACLAHH